jgi:DNA mismatch repair protein MutL
MPGDPLPPAATTAIPLAPERQPSVMSQPFRPFVSLPQRAVTSSPFTVPPSTWGSTAPVRPAAAMSTLVGWRFLGSAHGDVLLFEAPGGVVVLDRRAAHERVWFERLQAQFSIGEVASQRLLFAVPVELDAIGSALLLDRLKLLHRHGLEVAEFGRHFFRLEAVPVWLDPADAETFLRDLVGLMREGRLDEDKIELARQEVARLAAQKAVRLPAANGEVEAMALVADLFACQQPHTSPAGRPTHFELSRGEMAKRLQR